MPQRYLHQVFENKEYPSWVPFSAKYEIDPPRFEAHHLLVDYALLRWDEMEGLFRTHGPTQTRVERDAVLPLPVKPRSKKPADQFLLRTITTSTTAGYAHLDHPALLMSVIAEATELHDGGPPTHHTKGAWMGAKERIRLTLVSAERDHKEVLDLTSRILDTTPIFSPVQEESGSADYVGIIADLAAPFHNLRKM